MKPRTSHIKRKKPTPARTKQPRKSKKRKPSEFARIYHSKERVAFVASLPCIACQRTASDGHHITVGGMGRKADYDQIVPLCRSHHSAIHHHGPKTFAALLNVDLEAEAALTESRWIQHCAPRSGPSALSQLDRWAMLNPHLDGAA